MNCHDRCLELGREPPYLDWLAIRIGRGSDNGIRGRDPTKKQLGPFHADQPFTKPVRGREASVGKGGPELDCRIRAGCGRSYGMDYLVDYVIEDRDRRQRLAVPAQVKLMECKDATRPQPRGRRTNEACWIRLMHQHVPPNDEVERRVVAKVGFCRLPERHVAGMDDFCTLRRELDGCRGPVDPDYVPIRANQIGHEKGLVTGTATKIEHPHAGR